MSVVTPSVDEYASGKDLGTAPAPAGRPRHLSFVSRRGPWLAIGAFALAWPGMLLLAGEGSRTWGELLVVLAGVMFVLAPGGNVWARAFPAARSHGTTVRLGRARLVCLGGIALAAALAVAASLQYLDHPLETFGLAGWPWLGAMAAL